jgi:Na+-transporting methylmalonyl-CoA/oxaloacetate decarboxylase gamma subunit
MSSSEAFIVTGLGMAVVFVGLLLCILFIQVFNRMAGRIRWSGHGQSAGPAEAAPATAASLTVPVSVPSGEPIDAAVLAAISTVVEIERRLYLGQPGSRVTIRRAGPLS